MDNIVYYGVTGVSMAFFLLYIISTIVVKLVAKHLAGFTWSSDVKKLLITLLPLAFGVFLASQFMQQPYATIIGAIATLIAAVYCLRELTRRLGSEHRICRFVNRIPLVQRLV